MVRFFLTFVIWALLSVSAFARSETPILVDQFGYLPSLSKYAIIKDPTRGYDAKNTFTPSQRYAVVNVHTGQVVFEGTPVPWNGGQIDPDSGDKVWQFDFSELRQSGQYVVRDLERKVDSYRFDIAPNIYKPVLKAAFKTFYLQRAGFEKRAPFAPDGYADKASHLGIGQDPQSRLFSAPNDPATQRDLRGGWYDAGDYNKYTSWTASYIVTLLSAYIENPNVWTDDFGIPESGNGIPDVLDEVKWGLDWLERMQNADGAMLSVQGLDGASPPSSATGPSLYGPPNTSATVSAAAAFALAAKVYGEFGAFSDASKNYQKRALQAWRWAEANPQVKFNNNDPEYSSEGLAAGQQEVDADRLAKQRLIAAIYLQAVSGDRYFADYVKRAYRDISPMKASAPHDYEATLPYDLLYHARQRGVDSHFARRIRQDYTRHVLGAYNGWPAIAQNQDAYRAPVDGYWWGSNATKARRGEVFTQAILNRDILNQPGSESARDYAGAASDYLHYLHGVNPNGKTYLSNMGRFGAENSVTTFYHTWFTEDSHLWSDTRRSKYGPAPGFLVGGPNSTYARDPVCEGRGPLKCGMQAPSPPTGQPPAKSYVDMNKGWPINSWEVTENSNGYQVSYLRLLSKFVR